MKAKRIVSILLTGSMLLSLLPVSALAAAPVFDAPAQTTAKKAAPLVQEADASRSTEEEAATRSSRDLDAENGTADSITIQLNAAGKPAGSGGDGNWYYSAASGCQLDTGVFALQPSSEPGAESALKARLFRIGDNAELVRGTVGCETNNYGTISGGTFQGKVANFQTISGGTFQGDVNNYKTISDGTFQGEVDNDGTISDGTFQGSVYNSKDISGGTFQKPVNNYGGTISGGIFKKAVEVYASAGHNATIEGGTFEKGMKLANDGASIIISDGLFDGEVFIERCRSPLSITGGLFTQAVNASSIDDPTNLQITGGYFVSEPTLPNGSDTSFATVSDQSYRAFHVPVNGDWSKKGYSSLYVPSGSSEQPNTITVKTDTALIDCRAADADADVSIMSSVVRKGGNTYEIPVRGYEKIVLVTEEPAPPTPDEPGDEIDPGFSSGAAALGVVLGTAGLGYLGYIHGTSLYLYYALPGGFIPSTRQELANVLWTTAGKPDPVSTALYTDIPADAIEQQKAARWCAEQGLLSDYGATFGPDTTVTNARIIRAWNSLKKVPVPITN
jgi:energy-converting hydrogenase Eha subunit B